MRARFLGLAALLAVVVAVVAIAWPTGGGTSSRGARPAAASAPSGAKPQAKAAPASVPAGTPTAPPGRPIPILMYHAVEAPPAGTAYPQLWVPAPRFAGQMQMLHDQGYHAITMHQATEYWAGRAKVPVKPIVLTFDDGFASHASVALGAMRRFGWSGVLYLEFASLHTPAPAGITTSDVRRLLKAGWELGAHTMTHPSLVGLPASRLRYEVDGVRTALTRRFGVRPDAFCYPAGKYDQAAIAEVRRAGFATATTTAPGLATPARPFELNRIRVEGSDSPAALSARIRTAGG